MEPYDPTYSARRRASAPMSSSRMFISDIVVVVVVVVTVVTTGATGPGVGPRRVFFAGSRRSSRCASRPSRVWRASASYASVEAEAIAARAAAAVAPSPPLYAVEGGETNDTRVSPRRSPFAAVFSWNRRHARSPGVFG